VHFNGASLLSTASLTCTDSPFFGWAGWINFDLNANTDAVLQVSDQNNLYINVLNLVPPQPGEFNVFLGDNNNPNQWVQWLSGTQELGDNAWHSILIAADLSKPAGQKVVKWRFDDVDQPMSNLNFVNDAGSFSPPFSGLDYYAFGDGFNNDYLTGDVADVRMQLGTNWIPTGDFTLATRRLFIDAGGKPVDPAVATAALGTPTVLFSGNHTTFPTNQGSGGTFTLTGTLTDASTHP
jgi:hypothetical protein